LAHLTTIKVLEQKQSRSGQRLRAFNVAHREILRGRTYNDPVIEIMSVRWRLPERAPVNREHREEEDDDKQAFRSEKNDVYLPSCASRGLGRKVALGEPW
jgi:hypothetical protein